MSPDPQAPAPGVELKACPICGDRPTVVSRGTAGVRCSKPDHLLWAYGASTVSAIAAWNTRAQGQPTQGEGWRLVPVEPTPEMLAIVGTAWRRDLAWNYRAMLAAAPPPPQSQQEDGR